MHTVPTSTVVVLESRIKDSLSQLGTLPEPQNESRISSSESRFELVDDVGILALPVPAPLVDSMIAQRSLAVLLGEPGAGKTFLALDLALSVATGLSWLGRGVCQGPVVFIAAEGVSGIAPRISAWKKAHSAEGRMAIHFLREAVRLVEPSDVSEFLDVLRRMKAPPVLVVFDTLARSMTGADENSGRDMGVAIAVADHLREQFNATTLLVHHPTKKNRREPRGSGQLEGAADMMAALTRKDSHLWLTCEKIKDYPPFDPIELSLAEFEESCVVVPRRTTNASNGPRTLTTQQRVALRALVEQSDELTNSNAWADASGLAHSTFHHVRDKLLDARYVERIQSGQNVLYRATDAGKLRLEGESNVPAS